MIAPFRPAPARARIVGDDRGAVLFMAAIAMLVILSLAAIAIDFAVARDDRTSGQRASDAAVSAAGVTLMDYTKNSQDACQTAMEYLDINGVPNSFTPPMDCTVFPTICQNGITPSVSESVANSRFVVEITYPVEDFDPKMDPSAIGAATRSVTAADGRPCERIGISVTSTHNTYFGAMVGTPTIDSMVHSVARVNPRAFNGRSINLLLLERHDCNVASAGGSGSGIVVGSVVDPNTGIEFPGTLALDSDGTGKGCNNSGTVTDGGGTIRGDGEVCPTAVTLGTGRGCGLIELFAPGTPGCHRPACNLGNGIIAPDPQPAPMILTRAQVDWAFNCKPGYPAAYDIDGCDSTATTPAYIDQLVADVGTSGLPTTGTWQDYSPTYPCTLSSGDVVVVPEGNWRVNCNKMSLKGEVHFLGGNLVFDGDVTLTADGLLSINEFNSTPTYGPGDTTLDIGSSSETAAFAYFRGGAISKGAQSSIRAENTMVYFAPSSSISMQGGSGAFKMIAPTEGPFRNLALWSESSTEHKLAGQANIDLEGVFFAPLAEVSYQGNGSQQQVAAQFVSNSLSVGGNGFLKIKPRWDRMVRFPDNRWTTLIR